MPSPGSDAAAPGYPGAGGYILLVDDDEAILEVLVTFLGDEEGYAVHAARSGAEALNTAPADCPAVVLMDITLRNENAQDVARRLRERPGWEGVPLVLCTAASQMREVARSVEANGMLAKPFDLEDLLAVVRRYDPAPRPWHPS